MKVMQMAHEDYVKLQKTDKIPDEMLKMNPTLHFCTEWDDLVIDDSCEEFAACTCFHIEPED